MKKFFILPYKTGSKSAKLLAEKLGGKVIKRQNSKYKHKANHYIINWGVKEDNPNGLSGAIAFTNSPTYVALASNKLKTFQKFNEEGVSCVPWTTNTGDGAGLVEEWLSEDKTVFARKYLSSHSGKGIVIIKSMEDFVQAPLYTQYVKKKKEFRVHVFQEEVFLVQEKKKKVGGESNLIRSHDNGYVYCFNDIVEPEELRQLAVNACKAVGVNHAGVDIIWNEKQNKCYVLEINTAVGLCNTTAEHYANQFKSLI